MSDPTAQEPTMEEILASIRRIISEDDAPAAEPDGKAEEPVAAVVHSPEPEPAPPPPEPVHVASPPPPVAIHEEEDVLELTEHAPAPAPAETHGDLDVFDAGVPPASPPPPQAPAPAKPPMSAVAAADGDDDDRLISGNSEDKAASHFGLLSQSIAMPPAGRTLEDVVRQLLRPLLKEWLDENLPSIVEEKVQAEVERISRRRV